MPRVLVVPWWSAATYLAIVEARPLLVYVDESADGDTCRSPPACVGGPNRCGSAGVEEGEGQRAEGATGDRADNRDPRGAPVRRPLARDRQECVDDARPEVARRVDRVARGAAERQADAEHQEADEQRSQAAVADAGGGPERQHDEHEQEGPNDLRDQVVRGV